LFDVWRFLFALVMVVAAAAAVVVVVFGSVLW
jgi:hypothetical protein